MAYVSSLVYIKNDSNYDIRFHDGQSGQDFTIPGGGGTWNGDLWIPWVGSQGEIEWKPIKANISDLRQIIYIYQDYWYPSDANACKYIQSDRAPQYSEGLEIPGDNRGGGKKKLVISNDLMLFMEQSGKSLAVLDAEMQAAGRP